MKVLKTKSNDSVLICFLTVVFFFFIIFIIVKKDKALDLLTTNVEKFTGKCISSMIENFEGGGNNNSKVSNKGYRLNNAIYKFVPYTYFNLNFYYQNTTSIVYRKESNKEGVLLHL